jgi:hypothetical protein
MNPVNPLVLELSAHCILLKAWDLNGHPLLCVFLANDLR